jgi:lambda repressor-like predicted transcriptional regulator
MRFKPLPPGDDPLVAFAADLRSLIESQIHAETANADFARMAEVSPATLSSALGGTALPSEKTVAAILKAAAIGGTDAEIWQTRRAQLLEPESVSGSNPTTSPPHFDELKLKLATRREAWDAGELGDPDYRLNTQLLGRDDVLAAFTYARDGLLSDPDLTYLLASAIYWGHRYLRWLELAGHTAGVAEMLVDNIVSPFRRQRWRSAWLLQRFGEPLKSDAVALAGDLLTMTCSPAELERQQPILAAITATNVETALRENPDTDLDRDHARRSLLNEFHFEEAKPGARGRLSQRQG